MKNEDKIILDLCGGTGAWNKPYTDAGYDTRNITLPYYDVKTYESPLNVYGILAAPPCTDFAGSGARWWLQKDGNVALIEIADLDIVVACLNIISDCNPTFWALENPVGRLVKYLGKPRFYFNPCDYGDPYTKKTCLWGKFHIPPKQPVEPTKGSKMWIEPLSSKRSITPPSFAKAFFLANQ